MRQLAKAKLWKKFTFIQTSKVLQFSLFSYKFFKLYNFQNWAYLLKCQKNYIIWKLWVGRVIFWSTFGKFTKHLKKNSDGTTKFFFPGLKSVHPRDSIRDIWNFVKILTIGTRLKFWDMKMATATVGSVANPGKTMLFACSKCFSRHPFEELSQGQQLCKVRNFYKLKFL